MNDYIPLSMLNDFIFCPYSIYCIACIWSRTKTYIKPLHRLKAPLLTRGGGDEKKSSTRRSDIMSLPVYCDELGISGKIDVYKQDKHLLIERKKFHGL